MNVRILLAVAVIVVASRILGFGVQRLGQPRVSGEILAGIMLGPSVVGLLVPDAGDYLFPPEVLAALKTLAQFGLVLFMFLIGLDLDLERLRGQGHKAVFISHTSILVPFVLGSLLGLWMHPRLGHGVDRLGFVLFLGVAMAITAFPVLARLLQEVGLYRTRIGVLTITCAAVDDVTAWGVLAVVVAVVEPGGSAETLLVIALSLGFVVAMLTLVRPLLGHLPVVPVWAALVLCLACAWTTEQIGIHAIFGSFMAGAVMPRRDATRHEIQEKLEPVTSTLLLPVFFAVVGLATQVDLLDSAYLWAIAGAVVAVAMAGKWGGSMIAARLSGESWRDAATIGILMNTRGLTELVILTVGLELGLITSTVFTVMVLMALVTTFMAPPLLGLISPGSRRAVTEPLDLPAAPREIDRAERLADT